MSSITLASLYILMTSDGEDAIYSNVTLINLLLVEDFCERLPLWFFNIDFNISSSPAWFLRINLNRYEPGHD